MSFSIAKPLYIFFGKKGSNIAQIHLKLTNDSASFEHPDQVISDLIATRQSNLRLFLLLCSEKACFLSLSLSVCVCFHILASENTW